jgi:hypothetical protein
VTYESLADVVLVAHIGVVSFVILGLFVTLLGALCRWQWVRNMWFRGVHLALICYISLQALCGVTCPLTTWEWDLRRAANPELNGVATSEAMRFLQNILFYDLGDKMWIFAVAYSVFALLVVLAFVLVPPRFRRATTV